jgi:hypothetical protein
MRVAPSLSRTNSACQLNTEERVEKLLSIGYSHTGSRSELGCEHLEPAANRCTALGIALGSRQRSPSTLSSDQRSVAPCSWREFWTRIVPEVTVSPNTEISSSEAGRFRLLQRALFILDRYPSIYLGFINMFHYKVLWGATPSRRVLTPSFALICFSGRL